MRQNSDFQLADSHPITVSGIDSHQIIWTDQGKKTLCAIVIRAGKGYYFYYRAEPQK